MFIISDGTHAGFYVLPEMEYETSKPQVLKIRINLEKQVTLRLVVPLSLTMLKTAELRESAQNGEKVTKEGGEECGCNVQIDRTSKIWLFQTL